METVIICEGPSDEAILRSILRGTIGEGNFGVVPAGGESAAISLARTYLATDDCRVALVVDADTTDPDKAAEQNLILQESLGLAGPRERFVVLQAVPTIEAWLFADEALAREIFGSSLSDTVAYRARFEPKAVLQELLAERAKAGGVDALARLLESHDFTRLVGSEPIAKLRDFLMASVAAE